MPPQQRVNIQYSIEINELPAEVDRLSAIVSDKLSRASSVNLLQDNITIQGVEQIVELRALLAEIDHNLMDIENIMYGYIKFIGSSKDSPATESQDERPVKEVYPNQETLDVLEDKINKFKNSVSSHSQDDQNTTKKHSTAK